MKSFPSQGTWIEMSVKGTRLTAQTSSFPSQGTWIEIQESAVLKPKDVKSFPSQGTWIEIEDRQYFEKYAKRRSLHRERGLKYGKSLKISHVSWSFPSQGTWIEIDKVKLGAIFGLLSFPSQGTWIEIAIS